MDKYFIDTDITKASTLPASFYKSETVFESLKDKLFSRTWHLVEVNEEVEHSQEAFPFVLFPGYMHEPLVMVRNREEELKCFSNVCTHRGNILVQHSGRYQKFVCNYHGRRFSIDGKFEHMPEFESAKDFPRDCEDLSFVKVKEWNQFPFVSLNPAFEIETVLKV